MNNNNMTPVVGCFVKHRDGRKILGRVEDARASNTSNSEVLIDWGGKSKNWEKISELLSGFQIGWTVQDVPMSVRRKTLGRGTVVSKRKLGRREQVLVQLEEDGQSIWLPYENLCRIKSIGMRYERAEFGPDDHAERLRLRLLSYALENWNQLTGSLDRLDVDPLPHQIQLVHTILSSGNYNWLIADDVGLGKTIEVGLLLAALKRSGFARRVLVVCPAGLVRQWQDEMKFKFEQDYLIYGRDFFINSPDQWKLYEHVIVSIDRAKHPNHMDTFERAGGWDVVIFDEGHKLTRHASGKRADRFRLAEMLRPMSEAFLLLSGTPHQGYQDRFVALLELVRPDLTSQVRTLEANPEIVSEMILRNRKSEVTDAEGNLIFRGQKIHRFSVETSEVTRAFQSALRNYLKKGYKSGEMGGSQNRAIGFVMTTYRKLASSSIAAIDRALRLRLGRLDGEDSEPDLSLNAELEIDIDDLAEGGDDQDDIVSAVSSSQREEFFSHEREMLEGLLSMVPGVRKGDEKLRVFLEDVVEPLLRENKKLLVFTEYRGTQDYLENALKNRFPDESTISLINGSMTLDEKLGSIEKFNTSSRFLISTEAGGEGLNLHQACHVMVNYDLPWNPARLAQRIGRLYRYGQSEVVVVINLHAEDSFDNAAISLMLTRVTQIIQDMSPIGEEFNEQLYAEILGELLENIDLSSILQNTTDMEIKRTSGQIEEAIKNAQSSKSLHDEIFSYVSGFDKGALDSAIGFTVDHVYQFVRGMLPKLDIGIDNSLYGGEVLEIRLPESLKGEFPEFGQRSVVRIASSRRLAQKHQNIVLLDFESPFFKFLIRTAQSHAFDGIYASIKTDDAEQGAISAFKLRWQNDQGQPLTEEFAVFQRKPDNNIVKNPGFLSGWLTRPAMNGETSNSDAGSRRATYRSLLSAADKHLGKESSRFKHPNSLVELAAADFDG
jgi:hypothetical protein